MFSSRSPQGLIGDTRVRDIVTSARWVVVGEGTDVGAFGGWRKLAARWQADPEAGG